VNFFFCNNDVAEHFERFSMIQWPFETGQLEQGRASDVQAEARSPRENIEVKSPYCNGRNESQSTLLELIQQLRQISDIINWWNALLGSLHNNMDIYKR
jgi:hypothetical protein